MTYRLCIWDGCTGGPLDLLLLTVDPHPEAVLPSLAGPKRPQDRVVLSEAKERFAEQRQICIAPEGTRTEPGAPPSYKPGIAALYRELDVPVCPVATNAGVHWPRKGFIRKPGTIVFE